MPTRASDAVAVIIPLFARPLRASVTIDQRIQGTQLRVLAGIVHKQLHDLAAIVDILNRAGWEILCGEASLTCRHPSIRTKAQAEVALSLLGVECTWYSIYEPIPSEKLLPPLAEQDSSKRNHDDNGTVTRKELV